jgi:hypothetical protein
MSVEAAPAAGTEPREDAESTAARELVTTSLDAWRAKVRWTTAAVVAGVVGGVGAPVAFLVPFVGVGAVVAAASVVALPVGAWVAHVAVPSVGPVQPPPVGALQGPLGSLVLEEAMRRASPGLRGWAEGCLVLAKGGAGAAIVAGLATAALAAAAFVPLVSVVAALAPALGFLVRALAIEVKPLPWTRPPAPQAAARAQTPLDAADERKRPDGRAILEALRGSPVYRGQDAFDLELGGLAISTGNGADLLLARYPRLSRAMLTDLGVEHLTSAQTRTLERVFAHEGTSDGVSRDMVLVGWPGSGRTTLCNLLSFAAVAHGEGTVYCIAAESPHRNADGAQRSTAAGTRHASSQLRGWLDKHQWADRLQEGYAEDEADTLSLVRGPDVVFTDVKRLGDDILGKAAGEARGLLQRLRYVIIDHPDRLSREELVRLRVSIARLRMTARLYGRGDVTFLVMLPRLGNFQELAKWLLNNEQVHFQFFDAWYGPARVLGWVPPQEFVPQATAPLFARADFTNELVAVLSELGVQAQQLRVDGLDPMRIAVVDARPLLGPEFRAQLAELVLARLKETVPHTETLAFVEDWSWFGTADLRVERSHRFDVVVTVGIGPHPEHLVASLRSVVADDGLMCLVADPSPIDHESVRRMREPGWDPLDAVKRARYPSVLLPQHAEALVAFQMAALFQDFRERKIPERVIEQVFPTVTARAVLERWRHEALLARAEVFEETSADDAFAREAYVYQRQQNGIRPERYDVPWGCSNTRVWEVYDETARSRSRAVGRTQSSFIDEDRIFIDVSPMAMLRYPPSTVEVVDIVATPPQGEEASERYVVQGQVHVRQVDFRAGIAVDKRATRHDVRLLGERGFPRGPGETAPAADVVCDVLCGASADRAAIARSVLRPGIGPGGRRPALRLVGGTWVVTLREFVRDVVMTTGRLVEDHELVRIVPLAAQTRAHAARTFQTVGTVILLEKTDSTPDDLDETRAAHAALAGTLRNVLASRFVDFDREYRVVVLPAAVHGTWSPWATLPTPGARPVRAGGFAQAAAVVERLFPVAEADAARRASVEDLARVWAWVKQSLEVDAEGPATGAAALEAGRGTARACVEALALLLASMGAPVVLVESGDRAHVEVAVESAQLPAVLKALRAATPEPGAVRPHAVPGGAWLVFDPGASAVGVPAGDVPWTEDGWGEGVTVRALAPAFTPWRVVVHRLRAGETHPYDQVGALFSRELGGEILHACMDILEACDCVDGCSSCCGGLGTAPACEAETEGWDHEAFTPADLVSRRGGMGLLSALLARKPAPRQTTVDTGTDATPGSLNALVTQVIGTRVGKYRDGLWKRLFAGYMGLEESWLARAEWMAGDVAERHPNAAGLYLHAGNAVAVRKGYDHDFTLEVIVHEYVHNWQFRSGRFDVERLARSDDATQFMANDGFSNLVIEGHATWADHVFRFHRGLGASYAPNDERSWDAYKTGFFLIQGIVGAFGVAGLFRWLSGEDGPPLRSRDRRIAWPFTIGDAVRAFGLEQEARYGTFDGIDVDLTELSSLEEPTGADVASVPSDGADAMGEPADAPGTARVHEVVEGEGAGARLPPPP